MTECGYPEEFMVRGFNIFPGHFYSFCSLMFTRLGRGVSTVAGDRTPQTFP